MLNRAYAEVWSRDCKPGEKLNLPGRTLDYVVMVRGAESEKQGGK
jgi:hypothetical protein